MPELRQHQRLQLSIGSRAASATEGTSARRRARRVRWVALAGLFGSLLCGCITVDVLGGGEHAALVETVVRGRSGPKILLVDIDGVISGASAAESFFGTRELGTAARIAEMLDGARRDDEVAALLLRIDSPGGTATESELVYEEILRFKQERNVPVYAQFLGTAASGAYYVAMAADRVQAHPTTVTGSIGVLFTSLSFAGLMEKLGIEDQTLTGGEFKDAGSPFRRLTPTERAQLQSIVDDLHARFREIVHRGRPALDAGKLARLANGQVFSARTALAEGLVDSVGSLSDQVVALERQLGTPQSRVVSYHRPREIRRNLHTRSRFAPQATSAVTGEEAILQRLRLAGLERLLGTPGFHYLWWPGVASGAGAASSAPVVGP